MLLFIGGMPRSGSTYTFNIARQLLLGRGGVYQEASPDVNSCLSRRGSAEHVIVKGHSLSGAGIELITKGEMKAICTVRPLEDAVASWMQTFNGEFHSTTEVFREWYGLFRLIHPHSLVLDYEAVSRQPMLTAMEISKFLLGHRHPIESFQISRRFSKKRVLEHVRALRRDSEEVMDIEFSYFHRDTFYHRNHIRTHVTKLTDDQRQSLHDELLQWDNGEPFSSTARSLISAETPRKSLGASTLVSALACLRKRLRWRAL